MIDPKLLTEIQNKFPVSMPELSATELGEIWTHWEIQQALEVGDIDRAAELAEIAEDTIWF